MSKRAGEPVAIDDEKKRNLNSSHDATEPNSDAVDSDDCVILPPKEPSIILIDSDPEDDEDTCRQKTPTPSKATISPRTASSSRSSAASTATAVKYKPPVAPPEPFKYTTCSCLKPNCIFCIPEKIRKMIFKIYNGYPLIDPAKTIYANIASYTKVPEVHVTRIFNLHNRSLNRTSKKKPFGEIDEETQLRPLSPLEIAYMRRQMLDTNPHQQKNVFSQMWRKFRRRTSPFDFVTTILESGNIGYRRIKHRLTKRESLILLESNSLRSARCRFIRQIQKSREDNLRIVYVHQLNPIGGTESTKIFLAASAKGAIATAYLKNTNTKTFIKWLQQNVINTLTGPAVFVLAEPNVFQDYDTVPASNASKATIIEWLKKENVPFGEDLFKIELFDLIEQSVRERDSQSTSLLDAELKKLGHDVVYIPKENCDLNPLEYVLMNIKLKSIAKGGSFDLNAELHGMGRDKWAECFQRAIEYENTYLGIEEKIKNSKKNYHIDSPADRKGNDLFPKYTVDVSICTLLKKLECKDNAAGDENNGSSD